MNDDNEKLFALMLAVIAGGSGHPNPLHAAQALLEQFKKATQ